MDQEGGAQEDGAFPPDANRDGGNASNNSAAVLPAQVEMIQASDSTNNLAAAIDNNRRSSAPAAAAVPSNANASGLSNSSHQSMLRQLAHSPTSNNNVARVPNRNVAAGSPQEALRQAQQPQQPMRQPQPQPVQPIQQQQQQPQQPAALNINVANNNNNPPNNDPNHHPERAMETEAVYHPCSPSGSASSGWSVVETSQGGAGGAPPSARSLHAAALLNGIMYVFGGTQKLCCTVFAEKKLSLTALLFQATMAA